MSEQRCLFCKIIAKEIPAKIVHEDDDVIAFEDINPQAPTHILIIPRRHIASSDEMTASDAETVGRVIHVGAVIARRLRLDSGGYRMVTNCGEAAGQTVFHIHFHLLGGRAFSWPPG